MSHVISIDVTEDTVQPGLKSLLKKLGDPARLNKAAGRGALPVMQQQLRENARTNRNKFGARGSFWNRMLSGTRVESDADAAVIAMPPEMGLRIHGGTVRPVKSKYLSIPDRDAKEAYGKSPRDMNDLRFIPLLGKGKGGALVQRDQQKISYRKDGSIGRGRKRGGKLMYWLVPEATIQGNPDLIPTEQELLEGAERGLSSYLKLNQGEAA